MNILKLRQTLAFQKLCEEMVVETSCHPRQIQGPQLGAGGQHFGGEALVDQREIAASADSKVEA